MRIIKLLLFKLRQDLSEVFVYPKPSWGNDGRLDYNIYWRRRRPKGGNFQLSSWQQTRARLVLPWLSDDDVVLDLGGGAGEMLAYWSERKKITGICVDNNQMALDQAKSRGFEILNLDLSQPQNWSLIPECDYLSGFEIIEHLPNPEEFILAIKKRARKGLIFSVPNSGYYKHRLRLLFGRFPLQWVVHPGEHLRFWTVRDIKKWVSWLDLNLNQLIIYEGLPVLSRAWPSLFGQGIIIFVS